MATQIVFVEVIERLELLVTYRASLKSRRIRVLPEFGDLKVRLGRMRYRESWSDVVADTIGGETSA